MLLTYGAVEDRSAVPAASILGFPSIQRTLDGTPGSGGQPQYSISCAELDELSRCTEKVRLWKQAQRRSSAAATAAATAMVMIPEIDSE